MEILNPAQANTRAPSSNSTQKWTESMAAVLRLEAQSLLEAEQSLKQSEAEIETLFSTLENALDSQLRIIVSGIGKSGKIGQKWAATLSSTGSPAFFLHAAEALHGDIGLIAPREPVLILSQTGNSPEIIRLLEALKMRGNPVFGFTAQPQSALAQGSLAWISTQVSQEACPHNLAPTCSTTLMLALGDAIAVSLMKKRGFQRDDFAKNHPGGALGNRLSLRVSDLMHTGENIATLPPDACVDDILIAATQKKLGAVLITEGKTLLGIITDGDLRRALQKKEGFFERKAHDLMTKNPVTISEEDFALEALRLMENRPSQIHVLPVVKNSESSPLEWVGLIRLHDLVRSL